MRMSMFVFRSKGSDCRDRILHEDDAVYKFIRKLMALPFVADRKREQQAVVFKIV